MLLRSTKFVCVFAVHAPYTIADSLFSGRDEKTYYARDVIKNAAGANTVESDLEPACNVSYLRYFFVLCK